MSIRVRFAPSPTGFLHVGNVRTALFNWLLARKLGGQFILRIEDTDAERSETRFEDQLMEDLHWLGLDWDEGFSVGGEFGPYRQTERFQLYRRHVQCLLDEGGAYPCFCSPEQLEEDRRVQQEKRASLGYVGRCASLSRDESDVKLKAGLPATIRLRVRPGSVSFQDEVFGKIEVETSTIGDFILLRSDGSAQYNLACVVDDALMRITHVIRGEGHLSNTPRQILLYESLGWETPRFAHLSTILGPDGGKLSKRHGATSIPEFRKEGYLPEALLNYLSLLGWSPAEGTPEILSVSEIVKGFELSRVQLNPAVFDKDKLNWVNRSHLKALAPSRVLELARPYLKSSGYIPRRDDETANSWLESLAALLVNYIDKLNDIASEASSILSFDPSSALTDPEVTAIIAEPGSLRVIEALERLLAESGPGPLTWESYREIVLQVKQETGVKGKALFHPVRISITGRASGPELDRLVPLLETGAHLETPKPIPGVRERVAEFHHLLNSQNGHLRD
jgi:glutamyl-tRNA synthetase/nondiscriminating glutamyl-tRNA synthetase